MNAHLLPLACVYFLGAWVLLPLGWQVSLAYGLYVIASNLIFMVTICTSCANFGLRRCESGYGPVAARLAGRGRPEDFPRRFRLYIPLVAAGWVLPVLGGLVVLYRSLWGLRDMVLALVPVLVFSIMAFVVMPRSSRDSCSRCAQRDSCPGTRFTLPGREKGA
ncbi:MAG: hypothetical protein FJ149_03885 [Euryarchaeota archaeon]|nr:hypothetical protein [Euryarchaeota archaeon]